VLRCGFTANDAVPPLTGILFKFPQLRSDLQKLIAITGRFNFLGPLLALGGKLGQRQVIRHDYASST
jgi:hypothetical protein